MTIPKHPIHEERRAYQYAFERGPALFVGAITDVGPKRTGNEDSILAQDGLFVVADGMGGHQAGEIASGITITHFKTYKDSSKTLVDIVQDANIKILEYATTHPQHHGLGTTVVALHLRYDGFGEYAHVGDSRLYHLNIYDPKKKLQQLTKDHSLVQQMVDNGRITEEEALHHPHNNLILRGLGIENIVAIDSNKITAQIGDVFFLCSDGFSNAARNSVIEQKIFELYELGKDEGEIATALRDFAAKEYKQDNISVIVVRVGFPFPEQLVSSPCNLQKAYAVGTLEARLMKQYETAADNLINKKSDAKSRYKDLLLSTLITFDPFIRQVMVPHFAAQYLTLVRASLQKKEGLEELKEDLSLFYDRIGFKEHFGVKTERLVADFFNEVYSAILADSRERALQGLEILASFSTKESNFYAGALHFLKQQKPNRKKTNIPTVTDLYAVAHNCYSHKKWVTATSYLKAALALDDNHADAHELLAHVYLERFKKDSTLALHHLERAAQCIKEGAGVQDPVFVYRTLATLYFEDHQLSKGIDTLTRLGVDYLQKNKELQKILYDTARSCRSEAEQKQEHDSSAAQKLYNAALAGLETLPVSYKQARVFYYRGKCHEELGDLKTATKMYQQGLTVAEPASDARWDLQQAYTRVQRKMEEKR